MDAPERLRWVPWGTHLVHLFRDAADFRNASVRILEAGVEGKELCLWVPDAGLSTSAAADFLTRRSPTLMDAFSRGQLRCIRAEDAYYRKDDNNSIEEIINRFFAVYEESLKNGYSGMRVMSNGYRSESMDWTFILDYETVVQDKVEGNKILAVCSYPQDEVKTHQFPELLHRHHASLTRAKDLGSLAE